MPGRIRKAISFANVISLIALFVALGGAAYALEANSVGSNQVIDDSLRARDVKDGNLTGTDVKDSTLTGADVLARSLAGSDLGFGGFVSGLDLPSIPAQSCTSTTSSLAGVASSSLTLAVPDGTIDAAYAGSGGLVVSSFSGTNAVTVKVCNVTAGAINPGPQGFVLVAFPFN